MTYIFLIDVKSSGNVCLHDILNGVCGILA